MGGSIPGCLSLHVKVSLGKILNPKLCQNGSFIVVWMSVYEFLMSRVSVSPIKATSVLTCVWMGECWLTGKCCSPFIIYLHNFKGKTNCSVIISSDNSSPKKCHTSNISLIYAQHCLFTTLHGHEKRKCDRVQNQNNYFFSTYWQVYAIYWYFYLHFKRIYWPAMLFKWVSLMAFKVLNCIYLLIDEFLSIKHLGI